jgi:hypothetical protein
MTQAAINTYLNAVTITKDELQQLLDNDTWILPEDALKMGFATAIVNDNSNQKPNQSIKKQLIQDLLKFQTVRNQKPAEKQEPQEPEPPKEKKVQLFIERVRK